MPSSKFELTEVLDREEQILEIEGFIGQVFLQLKSDIKQTQLFGSPLDKLSDYLSLLKEYIYQYDELDYSPELLDKKELTAADNMYLRGRLISNLVNVRHFLDIYSLLSDESRMMLVDEMLSQISALVNKLKSSHWHKLEAALIGTLEGSNLHDILYRCAEITFKYAELNEETDKSDPLLNLGIGEIWYLARDLYSNSIISFGSFINSPVLPEQPGNVWVNEQLMYEILILIAIASYRTVTNPDPYAKKDGFLGITYKSVQLLEKYKLNTMNSVNDPTILARIHYSIALGCYHADEIPTCISEARAALDYYCFIAPKLRDQIPLIDVMANPQRDLEARFDLHEKDIERIIQLVKMMPDTDDNDELELA